MTLCCQRTHLIRRLHEAGFKFNRSADRVEIYRKPGTAIYVNVPRRDLLPLNAVRTILAQAKLSPKGIEEFLLACDVSESHPH